MTDEVILSKFSASVRNVASVSLALGYPTVAALPHVLIKGYKNVLAVTLGIDYSLPRADKVKQMLANPGAFSTAPAVTAAPAKNTPAPAAAKKPEPEPEEEEEMGLSLFD